MKHSKPFGQAEQETEPRDGLSEDASNTGSKTAAGTNSETTTDPLDSEKTPVFAHKQNVNASHGPIHNLGLGLGAIPTEGALMSPFSPLDQTQMSVTRGITGTAGLNSAQVRPSWNAEQNGETFTPLADPTKPPVAITSNYTYASPSVNNYVDYSSPVGKQNAHMTQHPHHGYGQYYSPINGYQVGPQSIQLPTQGEVYPATMTAHPVGQTNGLMHYGNGQTPVYSTHFPIAQPDLGAPPLSTAFRYPQSNQPSQVIQTPPGVSYHYFVPTPMPHLMGTISTGQIRNENLLEGRQVSQESQPNVIFAKTTEARAARPKVKLTFEDKRRIVEIHRSNSNLRQEDIAQQYGVDRSTISKILIQSHRWTGPPQPVVTPVSKPSKQNGGRFPGIEQEMTKWWDEQEAGGNEVKDVAAREHAKLIAKQMGFCDDRFKASAKWLDKFKERRNKPVMRTESYSQPAMIGYNPSFQPGSMYGTPLGQHVYSTVPQGTSTESSASGQLSRSQSSVTIASTDSGMIPMSGNTSQIVDRSSNAAPLDGDVHMLHGSISDISSISAGLHARTRSRSSPSRYMVYDPSHNGGIEPASGKVPRTFTSGMQRSQSVRSGISPSPHRPQTLHRTQSSTSSISSSRRSMRPASLAASAFGLTPMQVNDSQSALNSPMSSYSSQMGDRRISDGSTTSTLQQPFMNSLNGMNISPENMSPIGSLSNSSSNNSIYHQQAGISAPMPLTPITQGGSFMQYHSADYQPQYLTYSATQACAKPRFNNWVYPTEGNPQQSCTPAIDHHLGQPWQP